MNAIQNLLCAVWTYPQLQWLVTSDDRVYAPEPEKYFSLSNPRDRDKVIIKLESEHGWKIRKASGQWRAEKHGEWHERPILEDLVVLMVGRVK